MTREEALKILDCPQQANAPFNETQWEALWVAVKALKESIQSGWRRLEEERPPILKNNGSWLCSEEVLLYHAVHEDILVGRFEVDLIEGRAYWLIIGKEGKQPEFEELDAQLEALSDEGYPGHYRNFSHWMPISRPELPNSSNTGKKSNFDENCEKYRTVFDGWEDLTFEERRDRINKFRSGQW